jgi:hypothetical protein
MRILLLALCALIYSCSCSKDEIIRPSYGKLELMFTIKKADESAEEILPTSMDAGYTCDGYGPGCMRVFKGRVLTYEVFFIEYDTWEQAEAAGKQFKQIQARNWLIDDSAGEPPLERFFAKHLDSINWKKELDESKKRLENNESSSAN